MQIRLIIVVRCIHVTPSSPAPKREGAAPLVSDARHGRLAASRPRGNPRREARVHAHAGSGSARHQPLDLHPTRPAVRRDDRDGVGARLVPVDEVERFVVERRRKARAERKPSARPGRRVGVSAEVIARIGDEHAEGKSLGEIARRLNADGVRTSQGGRQWWSSTVRAVLVRSNPATSARPNSAKLST
jgi:hypothetical protein